MGTTVANLRRYRREWYARNCEHAKAKVMVRKAEIRKWFAAYKLTLECAKCGEDHPATLDFHHKKRDTKVRIVSAAVSFGWAKERIISEIKKCTVLCSNCHRKLHYRDR